MDRLCRGCCCRCVCILLGLACGAGSAEPLPVVDAGVLTAPLGPPPPFGGRLAAPGRWQVDLDLAVANYFSHSGSGGDLVSLDGESRYHRWHARRGVGERYEVGVEVPWISHGGGALDGFIDAYHKTLGLPRGGRNAVGEGNLAVLLREDGRVRSLLAHKARGVGDVTFQGGFNVLSNPERALALRASVRLPTGDARNLTGSGGVAAAIASEFSANELRGWPLGIDARIGAIVHTGTGLAASDAPLLGFGTLALSWRPARRLDLVAQIDVHSGAYRSPLRETGTFAAVGTLGGRLRVWKHLYWSLAVSEDLHTDVTPDVVIASGLGWRGRVGAR